MMIDLLGNRYQLGELLGEGAMGGVCQAIDRLTGQQVAVKRVTLPNTTATFTDHARHSSDLRLALAQEFRMLASLHHPNIIRVLDYGFDAEHQPYFSMDLLDGAQTILEAGAERPLVARVELLIQGLQALAYIHQRGLVHRDIKPANLLVTPEGQLKVLDFGLSTAMQQAKGIVGTLAYLAPEILTQHAASPTSDLYALGIIAYELLTGHYPFADPRPTNLISNILTQEPDFELVPDTRLEAVLRRWIAKKPTARYDTADAIIAALSKATDQPPPQENPIIRESFLQAAQFVGREEELAQLTTDLHLAMAGQGAAWLISGESGVGKSRLLDELRTLALVEGVLVLRGQAVEGGGQPFQVWRTIMRWLTLTSELSDLEAATLRAIIPDIEQLLGRPVSAPPEHPGFFGQQHLGTTILDLLRRQQQPLLILLEDLQWAQEDLEPLRQLSQIVADLPLLVVGTFRHDERPDLPQQLPAMNVIQLARLTGDQIAALSISMLGENGSRPDVQTLLQRETEGNAFFLIETVRALAEEAGSLRQIGTMTLPQTILAGGIKRIAQRRLNRVPAADRALLKLAAVAGRAIDLKLLALLAEGHDLDQWLLTTANVAVLERHESNWRFAHDKLREALLQDLSDTERISLHRRVAEAMEAAYPEDDSHALELTEHWRIVGDTAREAHYAQMAGQRKITAARDFRGAKALFDRALALLDSLPDQENSIRAQLMVDLATAHEGVHDPAADHYYTAGLTLAEASGQTQTAINALNGLAWRSLRLGKWEDTIRYAGRSTTLARSLGDHKGLAYGQRLLGLSELQFGPSDKAQRFYEQALTSYRRANNLDGVAMCLVEMGDLARELDRYDEAENYFTEAQHIGQAIGIPILYEIALVNLGRVAHARGDYEQARRFCEESLAVASNIRHQWAESFAAYHLGRTVYALQDYDEAARLFYRSLTIAQATGAMPLVVYVAPGMAASLIASGQGQAALQLLNLIRAHPDCNREARIETARLFALLARQEAVDDLIAWAAAPPPPDFDASVADLLAAYTGQPAA